jgi:hypothetical protein
VFHFSAKFFVVNDHWDWVVFRDKQKRYKKIKAPQNFLPPPPQFEKQQKTVILK